jgi:hypothetical protein
MPLLLACMTKENMMFWLNADFEDKEQLTDARKLLQIQNLGKTLSKRI